MNKRKNENNQVVIKGKIVSDFIFSHKANGKRFYKVDVECQRLSENTDTIQVMISDADDLIDVKANYKDYLISVDGEFQSYYYSDGERNHLNLFVFAKNISFIERIEDITKSNQICLNGVIQKQPKYRVTPKGRKISDFFLIVSRPSGIKDYIPCICWGDNSILASSLHENSTCKVRGRIQSRDYIKKISEEKSVQKTAYEVSISVMEL